MEFHEYPTCPRCGTENHDWSDGLMVQVGDGTKWEETCSKCGAVYMVLASLDVSFASYQQEPTP